MSTATYNIPIELNSTGKYTLAELKDKLIAYAHLLVSMPKSTATDAVNFTDHTEWVKKMEKYRILEPMDEKDSFLEALDERFK